MDTEILTGSNNPSIVQRLLPAVVPVLLIAMGYVDPGKWAAAVEGGARFGSDLVLLLLVFNFAAILCQYLSARIAMVTGRDLSQICSDEYDKATCIFLGVLTEISMIALDLTMILGIAQGLNLIFGVDLFTCVFLTAIDAILFPVFANLLDNGKVKFLCISMSSFVLLFYVLGVLFSQPEISVSMSGMLTKLSGESAFALMSLLGANVMPHNFYLHSSIIQQELGPAIVSKGFLFQDHFFAIICIFSVIFMVNFVLMNAAANVFYSTGLLTFQDALSLMDQVFRSSVVPFAFLLVLFVSDQITALTWSLGRQAVLHDFFGLDIPGWLHHVTIRIIAIIPALYCVWNSGPEGIYQLMISTQVVVALMLPSSVIPLFRIASSRSVMGAYKISQCMEFLAMIVFFGMLGLKIIFLVEMIFGNSDWVGNLKWSVGTSMSVSYIVLLITASSSFCLMLWLAATPLKSATFQLDGRGWNWDITNDVPESSADGDKSNFSEATYDREEPIQKHEPALALGTLESHPNMSSTSTDLNLPETLLDSDSRPHLTAMEDNGSNITFSSPSKFHPEESTATADTVAVSTVCTEGSVCESVHSIALNTESTELVEKTVRVEGDLQTGKDDEGDTWEPEESLKDVSGSSPSLTSEGPGTYRSLTGKSEDGGSGPGSFRLGRAARRQLASVLVEFWEQLFDSHGQITQGTKAKRLEVFLGIDSKVDPKTATPLKVDTSGKEFPGYFPAVGGRGSDSPMNSSVYDSTKFVGMQGNIEASYGVQRVPSSSWSSRLQLLDAFVQNSSNSALNSGERRYSSLRLPPSSDGDAEKRYSSHFPPSSDDNGERRYSSLRFPPSSGGDDYQPATVHGCNFSRIAKESSDYLNSRKEALTPKSPSLGTPNYRDRVAFSLGRRPQNGLSAMTPPGFSNPVVSRNTSLISERTFHDVFSPGAVENLNSAINTKKFHSSPDISGLSLPYRDSYLSDRSTGWESHVGTSLYPSTLLTAGASLPLDNLSPVKPYRYPFTLQSSPNSGAGSLWSKQPFEQFGVAAKTHATGSEGVGSNQSSVVPETSSVVDLEAKLLQSFRHCIMRLLKLEGSDWLFRQNDGADEDLIYRVAARERFLYEAEARETNRVVKMDESQYSFDRKPVCTLKNDETDYATVPNCGEGCVWRVDLIVSFGVWCIHQILNLSLTESRPDMWGKYTYVLNHLQGIIDPAFSKPRTPMTPCFCLQIPMTYHHQQQQQQRSSPPPNISNGSLPPPAKQGKGKCTTAAMLLDLIKEIEISISSRKGRSGTAAGDVAFPKGKENLASVLKRYKRRLATTKLVGGHEGASSGSRKFPAPSSPRSS